MSLKEIQFASLAKPSIISGEQHITPSQLNRILIEINCRIKWVYRILIMLRFEWVLLQARREHFPLAISYRKKR